MRTLMYAGKPLSDFHVVWDGSKEFDKPKKIANSYTIPYRNGNLIKSTESFENVSISYPCFIRENFEENYSELVNYLNSFDTYQRLESTEEPSIYRMAFLHSVITPKTSAFNQGGMFTITFDCMPQEWLKSGENEMSIDMQTTTYTDPVEVDIEYDDALVDNAVLTLSPVQDLNGQPYPWIDKVGRNKLNLVNMAKTETVNGITFTLTDEGKIYMNGTQDGSTTVTMWFPFASIETIPNGIWKINGLPSNMTFGDYGFSVFKNNDSSPTELYENNSEVTGTITNFGVWVYEGVTVNNVELKPMIRESTDTSDVWQPYEHTTNICPIYPANGKNLIKPAYTSETTVSGITITPTAAGVKVSGTPTGRYALGLNAYGVTEHIDLTTGERVTFSLYVNGSIANADTPFIGYYKTGSQYGGNIGNITATAPITWTVTSDYADASDSYIRAYVYLNVGETYDFEIGLQCEHNSYVTSYQPYQGIKVEQTGKNLFSFDNIVSKMIYRANVQKITANSFYLGGASGSTDNMQLSVNSWAYVGLWFDFKTTEETTITVSCDVTNYLENCNGYIRIRYSDTQTGRADTVASIVTFNDVGTTHVVVTATIPANKYVQLELSPAAKSTAVTLPQYTEVTNFMLEIGGTPSTYEPYTGTSYPYTLGQSVYGGTVDLATGVLTVTHGIVDLGSLTWAIQQTNTSGKNRYRGYISPNPLDSDIDKAPSWCTAYKLLAAGTTFACVDGFTIASNSVYVYDSTKDTMTGAEFKTAVSGYELVYPLATPQTYYLSAQDVSLLQGKNYFTSEYPLSVTITEGTTLTNPSYMKARPIIKLNSAGTGTVKLNGDVVVRVTEAPSNVPIYIDCENMNCYSYDSEGNVVNENGNVTLPEGYIEMEKGNNRFTATGQLEPTMIPRWWRL